MPAFGKKSKERLATCDSRLVMVFEEVVRTRDCAALCGARGEAAQNEVYNSGASKVQWPFSKHNVRIEEGELSKALDIAPYPIDWMDFNRWYLFAGYVIRVAEEMGVKLRWGGDWDGDGDLKDQNFYDLPHWEIIE